MHGRRPSARREESGLTALHAVGVPKTSAWLQLGGDAQRAVVRAATKITACGLAEQPWAEFRDAVAGMSRGSVGVVYTIRDGRVDCISAPFGDEPCRDVVERHARWTWDHPDRTANRAVSTSTLYEGNPEALEEYRRAVAPVAPGIGYQARVAIFEEGRMTSWYGALRSYEDGEFSRDHLLQLQALLPLVRPRMAAMRMFREVAVTDDVVASVLNALPQRARLVDGQGRWVYGNPLDAHAGEDRSPALMSIPVLLADRLHVVELREPPRGLRNRIGVPELVFAVAERWATGSRTDEIADELAISPLTVRTYVQRVYRRLGVNNRVALLNALALGSGCSEPREPCAAVDAQDRTPPEAAAGAPPPATSTESVDPR